MYIDMSPYDEYIDKWPIIQKPLQDHKSGKKEDYMSFKYPQEARDWLAEPEILFNKTTNTQLNRFYMYKIHAIIDEYIYKAADIDKPVDICQLTIECQRAISVALNDIFNYSKPKGHVSEAWMRAKGLYSKEFSIYLCVEFYRQQIVYKISMTPYQVINRYWEHIEMLLNDKLTDEFIQKVKAIN